MAVTAGSRAGALADLSSALTAAATRPEAVLAVAIRAGAELVGDWCGIRLAREDGGYDPVVGYPDSDKGRSLLSAVQQLDDQPLRESDRPVMMVPETGGLSGIGAPLVAFGSHLGYLIFGGHAYTDADLALAGEIASRVAVAMHSAQAVDRLRASEERYRRIVEATVDGVWQLNNQGIITFVNERVATMLGLPREDLIGLSVRGFLDDSGQRKLAERMAERREGRAEIYETRLIRANGSTLWVQISAAPLTAEDGHIIGSVCMITDITERVAARDMQRQLEQLRRQDSLGQLAGGIAHDFNNLLTVIAGSAEILAGEAEPDSERYQLASQIAHAAARGGTLTRQLLSFGRRSPHAHLVSVPQLLDGVRELLERAVGEHIRVDVLTEGNLWPVHADRGQLEQALVNLAANARDAMGRGGVLTIEAANAVVTPGQLDSPEERLRAAEQAPAGETGAGELLAGKMAAGRFVRLAVSDTGTGMDRPTQERAFEPFFTTKAARGAAGLGLATVYGIVAGTGGHIQLYSERGIGTTVKLFLPAADEAPEPAEVGTTPQVFESPHRRGHILVVEDQPELAQLIRYLLQPAGYTVTVATDAAAAIAHVHTGVNPDLLLTDVVMPGMTGPELAKALRARHPGLRVLYMSGYTSGVLNPQGHLDEGSVLLQKPFNRDTLLAAVARALVR
jgi:PAS domain S-box-containing protein